MSRVSAEYDERGGGGSGGVEEVARRRGDRGAEAKAAEGHAAMTK